MFAFNYRVSFNSASDVLQLIQNQTNVSLTLYRPEDVQNKRDQLPKLKPLTGAIKIHEILVQRDKVLVKNLCTDIEYRSIRQGVNNLARTAPVLVEVIENEAEQDKLTEDD